MIIGSALTGAAVPVYERRGRQYRDYSIIVRGGDSCRAVLDVALAKQLAGESAVLESDQTEAAPVRWAPRKPKGGE